MEFAHQLLRYIMMDFDEIFQSELLEIHVVHDNYTKMFGISCLFQTLCEQLIRQLSEAQVDTFLAATTDIDRIKLLYNASIKIPVSLESCGKSIEEAVARKLAGNQMFEKKQYDAAIAFYNAGVFFCPADDGRSQALFSVLIANRSAVLFELHLHQQVLNDIEWVHKSGWYPVSLKHKTILRKAKTLICLNSMEEARELLKALIDQATSYGLKPPKMREITALIATTELKPKKSKEPTVDQENLPPFEANPLYPSASKFITFREDQLQGRYAVATTDIPPGSVVLEEDPYAFVLSMAQATTNCMNCAKHMLNPYACFNCTFAAYCSEKCQEEAAGHHKIECGIISSIYKSGASINCYMALRIITQAPFEFFWAKKDTLKNLPENPIYDAKDYLRLYNLCTHADKRNKAEFIHYSFMAIYMLRLLKTTGYFPFETTDELREEEAFIASLILRHLQFLQFNAHEVSQMRNTDSLVAPYENAHVGGGIYPTLSLFNHSCEPSIIRYNKGAKMIVRTIKQVYAGDIIYENYGPIYSSEHISLRQKKMVDRYWFNCACTPCREDWPLFRNMHEDILPLKCSKCKGFLPVRRDNSLPQIKCPQCKNEIFIFGSVMKLMQVEDMTTQAEKNFVAGKYEKAILFYRQALEVYAEHMTPPFQDLVKIQQRLRICMLHDGNTTVLYQKPSTFLPIAS